jgi:hypothetical protein
MGIVPEEERGPPELDKFGKPKLPLRIIKLMKARGIPLPPGYEEFEDNPKPVDSD